MGKVLLALGIVVDEPTKVAVRYRDMLAMRSLASDGVNDNVVVMAGSDRWPWAVLVKRTAPGMVDKLAGLPPGRGVRMLICSTDAFDADVEDLRRSSFEPPVRTLPGTRPLRCCSVRLDALGLLLELVETPSPADDLRAAHVGQLAAGADVPGLADTKDLDTKSALSSLADAPLDHMAIGVLDVVDACAVVTTTLGCELYDRMNVEGATAPAELRLFAHAPPDGFTFVLGYVDPSSPEAHQHPFRRMIADRGGPGVHHVAHRVENLEAAVAEVRAAGGTLLSSIEQVAGLRQIFVSVAEDSLVHELVQRTGVTGFVGQNTTGLVRAESKWNESPLDEGRGGRIQ